MIKYKMKRETVINMNSINTINHIERAIKEELNGGWIEDIKLIGNEDNFYSVAKIVVTFSKAIKIKGEMIGYIEYDYVIAGKDGHVCLPSFKDNDFKLLDKRQVFFEATIEELNQ